MEMKENEDRKRKKKNEEKEEKKNGRKKTQFVFSFESLIKTSKTVHGTLLALCSSLFKSRYCIHSVACTARSIVMSSEHDKRAPRNAGTRVGL